MVESISTNIAKAFEASALHPINMQLWHGKVHILQYKQLTSISLGVEGKLECLIYHNPMDKLVAYLNIGYGLIFYTKLAYLTNIFLIVSAKWIQ